MRRTRLLAAASLASCAAVVVACSSGSSTTGGGEPIAPEAGDDTSAWMETGAPDAAMDSPDAFRPTGMCAATFGSALTAGFGRIDGTVYAVQKPSDTSCVMPNGDHVVLQVLMNGAVYRLVANVQSDRAGTDPKIAISILPHALPAPAFAEGWHLGAGLDYVTSLGAHAVGSFTPYVLADAVTKIASEVKVGDLVSVYGTSGSGRPESAHLIHRNKTNEDGAIVVSPTTAPRFLLFHFAEQSF